MYQVIAQMDFVNYICSFFMISLLVVVVGLAGSNPPHPPQPRTADDCVSMDVAADGMTSPLYPIDNLSDMLDNFEVYSCMEKMDDKDWGDF